MCLSALLFVSSKFILNITLHCSHSGNEALHSFDVVHMQSNLLLQNNQVFIHLNLQIVSSCFNFSLKLVELLLLFMQELLSLVLSVLLTKVFDALGLFDLEDLQLLAVVHGLLHSLVDGDQLLIVLHLLQLGRGLDLDCFHSFLKYCVFNLRN